MKPLDNFGGYSKKTVPEMIQILWALYADMATDPALADSARQVRLVAENLEKLREMARQVSMEDKRRIGKRFTKKARRQTQAQTFEEAIEWLRTVRTASPSKH
jgi:hypothetical protein